MVLGLAIGFVVGAITIVVLSCCIIAGEESRKEENEIHIDIKK